MTNETKSPELVLPANQETKLVPSLSTDVKPISAADNNYNYYPRTMVSLCVASYADISNIAQEVAQLGLNVAWGPAQLVSDWGIPYSLMYVAVNQAKDEYTVVIRGTDPLSLTSWIKEDFEIGTTIPFNQVVPNAPANAVISKATFDGLSDLLSLKDPKTNQSVTAFLAVTKPMYLFVTGHSLGGTLTPPLVAYLNYQLYGGNYVSNMAFWSFAGLTSGNNFFASYFNSLFNSEFPWRLHNPLDVAPFCFYAENNLDNIYDAYGLPWSSLKIEARTLIDGLFILAQGKNYSQPVGDQVLPVAFNTALPDWAKQAEYQHHITTYQNLVNQIYPV
jgi:hypothetical protein